MTIGKKRTSIRLKAPKDRRKSIRSAHVALPVVGAFLGNLLAPGVGGAVVGGLIGGLLSLSSEETEMARIPIFYSFHFKNDVMRVQQIRNIGSIEGNSPVNANDWEKLKRNGKAAVQGWIDQNMKYKRCVVVLIGSETASRPWVKYEIQRAWNQGKALIGIYIHNIQCPRGGSCRKGRNPFGDLTFDDGTKLSSVVPCYDPNPDQAYSDISTNIAGWIHSAIANKRN